MSHPSSFVSRWRPGLPLLGALLGLRLVLLLIGAGVASGVLSATGIPFAREWNAFAGNIFVVPVDLITIGVVAWLVAREGGTLRQLLGDFRPADIARGLGVAVLLLVVLLAGTFAGNLAVYGGAPPASPIDPAFRIPLWFGVWCLVLAPVTIAFAEELFYRGYLQPRWGERIGVWPGLLLVALFFGLQHIGFALSSPQAAFVKVLGTFLGGVVLGALYLRWRRLWPLVIGHWIADLIGLGLFPFLAALGN